MSDALQNLLRGADKSPLATEQKPKGKRQKRGLIQSQVTLIQMLATAGADNDQIAAFLGIERDSFERTLRRTRGMAARLPNWRKEGEAQILATIHHMAVVQKDMKALIWASKNRLGWSDKYEATAKVEQQFIVETRPKMTEKQWDETYRGGPPMLEGTAEPQESDA